MGDEERRKRRLKYQEEVRNLQRHQVPLRLLIEMADKPKAHYFDRLLGPMVYPSYIPPGVSCNVEYYTMSLKNADFYSRRDQLRYR
ncbi:MAG: hypothetical protein LQ350_005481 [Teloschistes chrysophthalmus]|nr:MAG: hypothetical protein LQ350_005481 [Niorma chrysophthalma]